MKIVPHALPAPGIGRRVGFCPERSQRIPLAQVASWIETASPGYPIPILGNLLNAKSSLPPNY